MDVGWDDVMKGVRLIADSLNDRPTMLVGIARGGLPILTAMASYLGIQRVGVVVVSVRASDQPFARRIERPRASTIMLPPPIPAEFVLIVDDIVRTGESMRLAQAAVSRRSAGAIKSATLFGATKECTDYRYAAVPLRTWVQFPWDNWTCR